MFIFLQVKSSNDGIYMFFIGKKVNPWNLHKYKKGDIEIIYNRPYVNVQLKMHTRPDRPV